MQILYIIYMANKIGGLWLVTLWSIPSHMDLQNFTRTRKEAIYMHYKHLINLVAWSVLAAHVENTTYGYSCFFSSLFYGCRLWKYILLMQVLGTTCTTFYPSNSLVTAYLLDISIFRMFAALVTKCV